MLSDQVGDRVAAYREKRGLRRQDLALRIAEITGDATFLTAPAIGNLETGRRGSDGLRRRTVSVDELMVLALALEVPPLLLLLPADVDDDIDIAPGHKVKIFQAFRWLKGEHELPGDEKSIGVKVGVRTLTTISRFIEERGGYNMTVAVLRVHLSRAAEARAAGDDALAIDEDRNVVDMQRQLGPRWDRLTLLSRLLENDGVQNLVMPEQYPVPRFDEDEG